jgi:hypothetical protein
MKNVKAWLERNPRAREEKIEQELMKMGITLYHIMSLLWDKTTRKYTNDFVIYKTQELIEMFINSLPEEVNLDLINERMAAAKSAIMEDAKDMDSIVDVMGAKIDNYPGSQYGLTIDFKIAILLYALNLKGITEDQIFEKYQN